MIAQEENVEENNAEKREREKQLATIWDFKIGFCSCYKASINFTFKIKLLGVMVQILLNNNISISAY